jgi:hypothetical protein
MEKNNCIVLWLMAVVLLGAPLFGQTGESLADKVSFELEFNASVLSVDSEGVVDSLTDAGFNEDGTKIGLSYEDELWGASAALKFGNESLRIFSSDFGDMSQQFPLALDELYAWIKPFGEHFKFTVGIFENTDGVTDYTEDIDDFDMGVFIVGADGRMIEEPTEITGVGLKSGFLTEATFGLVTAQLLIAPNYSKESASRLVNDLFGLTAPNTIEAGERFFRIGGRVIADIDGVGTFSALFKSYQWPIEIYNGLYSMAIGQYYTPVAGSYANNITFGAYADITAVENLGISLGYTGFMLTNDNSDYENILWNGIDLRATWTGIETLSVSTHNNISLANGVEKNWALGFLGKDESFLHLYNSLGATKELTEDFSVSAQIGNVFSVIDRAGGKTEQDTFWVEPKFIAKVGEHAEFSAGLRLDVAMTTVSGSDDETMTTFSIPVGIKVNF